MTIFSNRRKHREIHTVERQMDIALRDVARYHKYHMEHLSLMQKIHAIVDSTDTAEVQISQLKMLLDVY